MAHSAASACHLMKALRVPSQDQTFAILQHSSLSYHGMPGTHLLSFVPHPGVSTIAVSPRAHGMRIVEHQPKAHSMLYEIE